MSSNTTRRARTQRTPEPPTAAAGAGVEQTFDVAIVGHGPTGVIAANLLGKEGIRTLVIERDQDLYSRARAVTVNDWTLRIFQDLGIDEKVKQDMDPLVGVNWKTYAGRTVLAMKTPDSELSQPAATSIFQPLMEADLRSVGATMPSLDIRYGHTFTGLRQDQDAVTLSLTDAQGQPYTARARYVLGADGGQSRVREAVGIDLEGSTKSRRWIIIDGQVVNWWQDCNTLNMWCDPHRPMVDIPLAKGNHRWEIPLAEGERDEDFADEAQVWGLLEPLGMDPDKVRLKGWAFYNHHVRHASRWREGRVVLIGDAAHLMPPWAGQGMQSGIRDAANAAWKLAAIIRGELGDSVLDTVQTERWPHVKLATDSATTLGTIVEMTDPKQLALRDHVLPALMKVPGLQSVVNQRLASPDFQVADGWLAVPTAAAGGTGKRSLRRRRADKRSAVGRMLIQPMVFDREAINRRLDDVVGYGFAVFGLDADPRETLSPAQIARWSALGARFVAILGTQVTPTPATPDAPVVVIDHTGALRTWFTAHRCRVVAVRPDHFVAAADDTGLDVPYTHPLDHSGAQPANRTMQEQTA